LRHTRPGCEEPGNLSAAERRARKRAWANLLRRVFEFDALICRRCGAEIKIISIIFDPEVIDAILRHLRRTKKSEARTPPQPRGRCFFAVSDELFEG
jgi:hypothetical protein